MSQNVLKTTAVIQLVREALARTAAVVALVPSDRIRGGFAEGQDWSTAPKPLIAVLVTDGGRSFYNGVVGILPVEIWTMSATSLDEAHTIYDEVFAALNAEGLSLENVDHRGLIRETQRPVGSWFDAAKCWTVSGRWNFSVVRDRQPTP